MIEPYSQDLSYLNRDLSKVVSLDTDEDHVSTHPDNAIIVPKWKGDVRDKGLIDLIPFLECVFSTHARKFVCPADVERDSHRNIQT
jgi:TFIIF-interacting CTD phosphatase-like protein